MNALGRFLTLCSIALAFSTAQAAPVEQWVLDLFNEAAQRPVKVNLWYPAGDCKDLNENQRCLAPHTRRDRVVVLSHGSMGSANDYNWLARALVARGYVVAGVSHFGESWVYGQETIDPSTVLRYWQRPQDISFVLDTFAERQLFQLPVNWNRVIATGHSAGGQTAAALAGVRFDIAEMVEYCESEQSATDRSCAYGRRAPLNAQPFVEAYGGDYSDERIEAIVMLDPAIGPAATETSLASVDVDTLVVGATNNDFLPYEAHAGRYAELIDGAQTLKLTGHEGHFVFVDPCDHGHDAMGVSICKDREGVDRTAVHTKLAGAVTEFIADTQ